jgi:acetyl-CoA carboxylase biotin carboxyl carrier protein
MDIEKLQELIRIFEASDLCEMEIEEEGRRMLLRKMSPHGSSAGPGAVLATVHQLTPVAAPPPISVEPAQTPPANSVPNTAEEPDKSVTINCPMVGVFYAAHAPTEQPFVRLGETVEENQTICIVEAMKLMNEVTAKFPAVIEQVLVENGEPVEYGQPLFLVRPIERV